MQRFRHLIINNDVPKVVVIFVLVLLFFFGGQKFFLSSCILSEITNFQTSVVIFGFALFFWRTGNLFFLALLAQALAKVQHVRLCCELAGFCCEGCDRL